MRTTEPRRSAFQPRRPGTRLGGAFVCACDHSGRHLAVMSRYGYEPPTLPALGYHWVMTESSTATLELDDTGSYRLWSADARFEAAHPELYATQPALGALVYGDLCDITVGRRYCGADAVREAADADGSTRILCAHHAALYFPTH